MTAKLSLKKRFFCKILKFWMKSLRVSWKNPEKIRDAGVLAFWHRDLFAATAAFRNRGIVAFISPSGDGEILAEIAADLGYRTVRGSSSEKTFQIRNVLRSLRAGNLCAMALDGPKGPAGVEKPGSKWLAKSASVPCLKPEILYGPHFSLSSWDRAKIPLPFSKISVWVADCQI